MIHIQGDSQLFSCYDIDDKFYIVFYTDTKDTHSLEELVENDKKVMSICEDIKNILAENE